MELMDIDIHRPSWVKQGKDFHQLEKHLWQRRNLSRFKLDSGKLHYGLSLRSDEMRLHGIADMAIETDEMVYPVEFKLSPSKKKRGDILQLTAYSMLLEKHFNKPSPLGFLTGPRKTVHVIDIKDNRKYDVLATINEINKILQRGLKPESSASVAQCCTCEFVNYCNDRL